MHDLREKMRSRLPKNTTRWFEVRNEAGPKATIRIYQEIGIWGVTAEDFVAELEQITAPEIEVQINSPGGEVFDGLAIFNALRTHPARITTRVDGIAASAASVILQAGDHRVILEAGQVFIHEAWGLAIGPAREMREFADLLDQQNDVIAGIYASRSGGDKAKFLELMAAETWLTHDAAVEAGLADEVVVPARQDGKDEAKALTKDDVLALFAEATAALQIPPAKQEEPTPPSGERVDQEQAQRLLDLITLGDSQ